MLNEFEQTQKFNKEKLLMRNIGSPKQPSGVTPSAAHRWTSFNASSVW